MRFILAAVSLLFVQSALAFPTVGDSSVYLQTESGPNGTINTVVTYEVIKAGANAKSSTVKIMVTDLTGHIISKNEVSGDKANLTDPQVAQWFLNRCADQNGTREPLVVGSAYLDSCRLTKHNGAVWVSVVPFFEVQSEIHYSGQTVKRHLTHYTLN